MSVDFSQFFNGPIRDSLIAQVSGYLDISRPQATTAYDKAVALVIGAMAQQAGKPEGAQALAAHIRDSQTQTSLTSSALSPTVLTNDQFAQIVTLGESEQAIILGQQQEAVTAHLEVATGLDTKAVGSLLSIVVPFVLSFLKNNITTESEPAQSLPVLFATQAPHVAAQLDAPALAALGQDSLEGLFGRDALAAADANTAATSQNGKNGSAQGATTHEKPANGWFKWVLTLAVVLAGAAWIKSCTQSDTTTTENAKPADQQQSATDAPASDAATAPAATPANNDKAEPGDATAPSANFPEPASSQSAGVADAPAAESAQTDSAQADSAKPESAKPESAQTKGADTPATAVAPAATAPAETTESKQNTETVPPAGEKPGSEQSASASGQPDAPVTDSTQPETSATAEPEPAADTSNSDSTNDANDGQTAGPTYGQASDTMEPEAQSDATAAAASAGTASTDAANAVADKEAEQKAPSPAEQASTDNTKPAATDTDSKQADQMPAPAAEGAAATSTAPDVSSATAEQTGSSSAATANTAADSATTDTPAADTAAPGKTTTFAEPAPLADKPPATSTPEQAGAAGKTTTFAASDSSGSQPEPAQPQETKADQAADTQSGTAPASDGVAPSSTTTASSGKTTTFGATGQDDSASAGATQTDSNATAADSAGQPPVAADSATGSGQSGVAAQVELERDGDALRIRGTVPDESARNRILNAAKFVDGHSKIEDELQVDSQALASKFDDYSGLLSLLRGYHDVNVSLKQEVLTLTGQVSSSEEKEALTTKVQNLVGADIQVENQVEVAAPARVSAPDAAAASAAPPQVQFASGSAQVDSRFHDGLDQYAQQLIESGKSVRLVGFADESGSEPGNEALSKRRAESVKAYLILRGVQARQIQTEGQGTQAPVADNTTEAGRAKNRRVEIQEQQ